MENKLSKEKIIQAAFQLLEAVPNLEALSMRKIAKQLNVQAPAIYWYFRSKQALLQSMAEKIEQEFITPEPMTDWKETIELYMERYYDLYQKYPCSVEIEIQTVPAYPSRLKHLNAMMAILVEAGFSIETSYMTITSLQHLLFGLLMDSIEEKKLYDKVISGDVFLKEQIILMKQYVKEENLIHLQTSIDYRRKEKQKDYFKRTIQTFLNGLSQSQ